MTPARPSRRSRATPRAGGRPPTTGQDAAEVVSYLRRLFKAIHEYSKAVQRRSGLSSPQLWALRILAAEPDLSLGELAERMYAHPSTVSGIVDRLEERGMARRAVHGEDRRTLRLNLTRRGRAALGRSPSPVQIGLRRALQGMAPSRLRQLRRSLKEVVREAEVQDVDAPFFET